MTDPNSRARLRATYISAYITFWIIFAGSVLVVMALGLTFIIATSEHPLPILATALVTTAVVLGSLHFVLPALSRRLDRAAARSYARVSR